MPITYHIDVARRMVVSHATGRLTDGDLQQLHQQLRQDPAFDPTFCQLVDWTGVTDLALTTEGRRQRVRQLVFQPGTPRAIVASSPVQYGMARMIQILQELQGSNIRVFREPAAVQAWLDEACATPSPSPAEEAGGIP